MLPPGWQSSRFWSPSVLCRGHGLWPQAGRNLKIFSLGHTEGFICLPACVCVCLCFWDCQLRSHFKKNKEQRKRLWSSRVTGVLWEHVLTQILGFLPVRLIACVPMATIDERLKFNTLSKRSMARFTCRSKCWWFLNPKPLSHCPSKYCMETETEGWN